MRGTEHLLKYATPCCSSQDVACRAQRLTGVSPVVLASTSCVSSGKAATSCCTDREEGGSPTSCRRRQCDSRSERSAVAAPKVAGSESKLLPERSRACSTKYGDYFGGGGTI